MNWMELEVIRLALVSFQAQVKGKHILAMCDNQTAMAYINKQGGMRYWRLFALTKKILLWCHQMNTIILCRHIPGQLNVRANQLSRKTQVIATEWSLHLRVIQAMWAVWGFHT